MDRLDKVLASQNIGSRKECGAMIRRGEVFVNGGVVKRPEHKVEPERDEISLGGKPLRFRRFTYLMMNKPQGVLSATRDPKARTVLDLLPPELSARGLFPAGRLDRDTEGLLIITNDGDFAHRMLSPKKHVYKIYHAVLDAPVGEADRLAFETGLELKDMTCLPAELAVLEEGEHPLVSVRVREGKFHQVKRMFLSRGRKVLRLKRVKIGGLELDKRLGPGETRELEPGEITQIFV